MTTFAKKYMNRENQSFGKGCRIIRRAEFLEELQYYISQGKMELEETLKLWKQKTHILRYFNDSDLPKSSDFLTRFYEGHNWLTMHDMMLSKPLLVYNNNNIIIIYGTYHCIIFMPQVEVIFI